MTTSVSICVLVILTCLAFGDALKYCQVNDDCSDLGNLICVKSQCEWGMCSCARGFVSRYIGSEKLYQCVPQKKIGEGCSTDQDSGVCGAFNSYCRNGTCSCKHEEISVFGGEACLSSRLLFPGEMASGDSSTGVYPAWNTQAAGDNFNYPPREVLDWNIVAAVCSQGQTLTLNNKYYGSTSFQGKMLPRCRPILLGEMCITQGDCSSIGGNKNCVANKCACTDTNYAADVTKENCVSTATADLLAHGVNCTSNFGSSLGTCNPTSGLQCGDVCSASDVYPSETAVKKCACHPFYTTSGTTCTARAIGSACYGDYNCKGINLNAVCVDGTCKDAV